MIGTLLKHGQRLRRFKAFKRSTSQARERSLYQWRHRLQIKKMMHTVKNTTNDNITADIAISLLSVKWDSVSTYVKEFSYSSDEVVRSVSLITDIKN